MFNNLVGNENVKQTLRRLIAKGRVPNSLLFAGDEGIGKRQFAMELARAFVCSEPVDGEGCGVCPACRRVDNFVIPAPTDKNKSDFEKVFFGGHSDVGKVVTYKRFILIDAIRDVERHANFLPNEAKARFFIIDAADKMNDQAANALLKTLEEPPSTSHIFLITSRPDSLLPTIRSRCQTLRFAPVDTAEIEKYLVAEKAYTHDEARLAARLSRGSIGRAVSINVEEFRARREKMLAVVSTAVKGRELAVLLKIAEEMNDARNKEMFEENLDTLQSLIHDVWTINITGETHRVVNSDLEDKLADLAGEVGTSDLPAWLRSIDQLREDLIVNINRKVAADALFVSMASG